MPTRSYKCTNEDCREFELDVSTNISDKDIRCPYCESEVQRLYRPIAWNFTCQGSYNQTRGK